MATKVGVVGAGVMGSGIATVFASTKGYEVVLCDVSLDRAVAGVERITSKLDHAVGKNRLEAEDRDATLASVRAGVYRDLAGCALVLEAALEDMDVKKELFRKLEDICPEDVIFATNTSSLSITELATALNRPLVGMHFFNPAETMKLVEVCAGLNTPPNIMARVMGIARDLGKVPVEVTEGPGFLVNRVLVPMINEAIGILAEGHASAEDIDTALKLGANHPMGPLALGDLVGLDVCLAIMEIMQSETGDPKYRPHPLLRKMVRGGRLGRKTGRGFFEYPNH